jgi:hypothetical protein
VQLDWIPVCSQHNDSCLGTCVGQLLDQVDPTAIVQMVLNKADVGLQGPDGVPQDGERCGRREHHMAQLGQNRSQSVHEHDMIISEDDLKSMLHCPGSTPPSPRHAATAAADYPAEARRQPAQPKLSLGKLRECWPGRLSRHISNIPRKALR